VIECPFYFQPWSSILYFLVVIESTQHPLSYSTVCSGILNFGLRLFIPLSINSSKQNNTHYSFYRDIFIPSVFVFFYSAADTQTEQKPLGNQRTSSSLRNLVDREGPQVVIFVFLRPTPFLLLPPWISFSPLQ
jgi:hypothetical protein